MIKTLDYILKKYELDPNQSSPLTINGGRREKGLALLLKELGFKIGVEIGTYRGEYAEILFKTIPNLKLFCIDIWKSYKGYKDFGENDLDDAYVDANNRLASYRCVIMKDWSMNAVQKFKDEELDFVFIDGNHDFKNCTDDIAEWSKKVRKGGIVAGHDLFDGDHGLSYGVKYVVPAWCEANRIKTWFVVRGDKCPSWFYVRE